MWEQFTNNNKTPSPAPLSSDNIPPLPSRYRRQSPSLHRRPPLPATDKARQDAARAGEPVDAAQKATKDLGAPPTQATVESTPTPTQTAVPRPLHATFYRQRSTAAVVPAAAEPGHTSVSNARLRRGGRCCWSSNGPGRRMVSHHPPLSFFFHSTRKRRRNTTDLRSETIRTRVTALGYHYTHSRAKRQRAFFIYFY